jgi:hypothetical protein
MLPVLCGLAVTTDVEAQRQTPKTDFGSVMKKSYGTGQTTGHIANLTTTNPNGYPIAIEPQMVYIPSDGKYQPYIGRIPDGIVIQPGATVTIPIHGYCADVHKPPVTAGEDMIPPDKWIPVTAPQVPEPMNPPGASVPPTAPEPMNPPGASVPPTAPEPMNPPGADGAPSVPEPMNPPGADGTPSVPEPMNPPNSIAPPVTGVPVSLIPRIPFDPPADPLGWANIPGYKPHVNEETATIITWPGSVVPVYGTIDPGKSPVHYGHLIADVLTRIEEAIDDLQADDVFTTPFTPDPARERESVIQQTFWIYTAALTDDSYEKDDFVERVYDQFKTQTGNDIFALPKEQKELVDTGVEEFWGAFQATGIAAKVISSDGVVQAQVFPHLDKDKIKDQIEKNESQNEGQGDSVEGDPEDTTDEGETEEEENANCSCDTLKFTVATDFGGVPANGTDQVNTTFSASKSSQHKVVITLDEEDFNKKNTINVTGISVRCRCGGALCEYYSGNVSNPDAQGRGKVEITKVKATGAKISDDGESISGNGISVEATPVKDVKKYFIEFKVSATCMTDDCGKATCVRYISIKIEQKKE